MGVFLNLQNIAVLPVKNMLFARSQYSFALIFIRSSDICKGKGKKDFSTIHNLYLVGVTFAAAAVAEVATAVEGVIPTMASMASMEGSAPMSLS